MSFVRKYLRLLPAVVILGAGLLAIKGIDIARAAQAVAADPDQPDNTGLAPSDNGGAPATKDFADADGASGSAAEVDVLSSLTQRRAQLDARERALDMRENLLNAGEARVDQKIAALKDLQTQVQALIAERDDKQKAQIASLVKSYGPDGTGAKRAAAIFNTMPDEVLIPIAKAMKPGDLGQILAAMNPDAAQKLTVKLANLLKLPDTTPAICPQPTTAADAALPTPLQTAALSPPGVTPVVSPLPPPPVQAAPPPQAATTPKPTKPTAAKPTTVKPSKPVAAATPAPTKPTTATTPAPTTPTPAPAAVTPTPAPAATPPATQAASGPPAATAPHG